MRTQIRGSGNGAFTWRKTPFVMTAVLVLVSQAIVGNFVRLYAQPAPAGKPPQSSVAEYKSMLEDLRKEPPKAAKSHRVNLILMCQETLAEFGYGTKFNGELDTATKEAIREYQRRNGLAITGDLTAELLAQLHLDKEALKAPTALAPLSVYIKGWDSGTVVAEGNWFEVGTNDRISLVSLICHRDWQTCMQAQSEAPLGPEIGYFDITDWTDDRIVATREGLCGRTELVILRKTKNLSLTNTLLKDTDLCVHDWNLGNPGHRKVRVWAFKGGEELFIKELDQHAVAVERVRIVSEPAKGVNK
jgi:hypothetical protein